jgi:Uncharacterised protein family (UPF0158)
VDDRQALTRLRGLVARGDYPGLIAVLSEERWPADSLQLIGDGLEAAVRHGAEGAAELSDACVSALRERDWVGDRELADALGVALGSDPVGSLRPLPVDLEELATILEGDPLHGGGRIDLATGEVWPQSALEYAEEVGELDAEDDDERWLWVESNGSREPYADMVLFIDRIDDPRRAERLTRAIEGRGPFRRFRDALGDDLMARWHSFSDDRQRGRARRWLAGEGFRVGPRPAQHL